MDPFTSLEPAADRLDRRHGVALAVAALIIAMVTLSIVGSALWRPEPLARGSLELGNATPVRLAPSSADKALASVLQSVAPTVAFITLPELGRSGSGVVVHEAGFVVTNAHVVDGAENILVAFDDGNEYPAELFGIDVATDLAVLKLDTDDAMPVAALGDSDALRVGEFVLALGAPFGLEASATSGIVSGLHRSGLGIARFEDFIVTDAPINRGNSGGPLINLRGEVIGINTAIIAGEEDSPNVGTFAGVGFAIPVNVMRVVAQRLIGDGGLVEPAAPADGAGSVSDAAAAGFAPRTVAFSGTTAAATEGAAFDVEPAAFPSLFQQSLPGPVVFVKANGAGGLTVGTGTGSVVDVGGTTYVITNEHVVRGAGSVTVYFEGRRHRTGVTASLLAANIRLDLALLGLPDDIPVTPLRAGDPSGLSAGSSVVAVAARLGDDGVRPTSMPGRITEIPTEVSRVAPDAPKAATDIDIATGDSGGPLLDEGGAVVAVMVARDRENPNGGTARRSYAILLTPEVLQRLELETEDPGFDPGITDLYPRQEPGFIFILSVEPGGMAEALGLQAHDRIMSINGQDVPVDEPTQRAMYSTFLRMPPGSVVPMVIARENAAGEFDTFPVEWTIPERSPEP